MVSPYFVRGSLLGRVPRGKQRLPVLCAKRGSHWQTALASGTPNSKHARSKKQSTIGVSSARNNRTRAKPFAAWFNASWPPAALPACGGVIIVELGVHGGNLAQRFGSPVQILLTNDDGIYAPGLAAMERALRKLGDVAVVAPATEQSGVGAFDHLSPAADGQRGVRRLAPPRLGRRWKSGG